MTAVHFTTIPILANLTRPIRHKESHLFALFIPEIATLCMLVLKIIDFSKRLGTNNFSLARDQVVRLKTAANLYASRRKQIYFPSLLKKP